MKTPYAEDASTEELRQKWGRVLSAEIRKPGTFSRKALRVVEELDRQTAQLFERLCQSRLDDVMPKCLVGELSFAEVSALVSADLEATNDEATEGQEEVWFTGLGEFGVAFPKMIALGKPRSSGGLPPVISSRQNNGPAIPVYVLTSTGRAVAEILPNHRRDAFLALMTKFREWCPGQDIKALKYVPSASHFELFEI